MLRVQAVQLGLSWHKSTGNDPARRIPRLQGLESLHTRMCFPSPCWSGSDDPTF